MWVRNLGAAELGASGLGVSHEVTAKVSAGVASAESGLTGAGGLASKVVHLYGAGYWQEASVPPRATLSKVT